MAYQFVCLIQPTVGQSTLRLFDAQEVHRFIVEREVSISQQYADQMVMLAERYADDPTVIGFDIMTAIPTF